MLKLDANPPIRTPEAASVCDLDGDWFVAHTKARNEKAFAWDLLRRGAGYFLPLVERTIVSGGRRRRGLHPLFPGYVFFCGNGQTRYEAMCTGRLCNAIAVRDRAALIAELVALETALAVDCALDLFPSLPVGARCRVKGGRLDGLVGTIVHRDGNVQVVLSVTVLGQGAAFHVEPELLEPLGA